MKSEQGWFANTLMAVSFAAGVGVGSYLFLDGAIDQTLEHPYTQMRGVSTEEMPIDVSDIKLVGGMLLCVSGLMSLSRIE